MGFSFVCVLSLGLKIVLWTCFLYSINSSQKLSVYIVVDEKRNEKRFFADSKNTYEKISNEKKKHLNYSMKNIFLNPIFN